MNIFISLFSILIAVAFYTLLERKILSYAQIRKGPNKVGYMGIIQPISDAIKLFNKNLSYMELINIILFSISPATSLLISLLIILILPYFYFSNFDINFNIIMFLFLSSISVYSMLLIGWSSNSKYSHLGAIRSVAQMISYEVSFFLIILFIILLSSSYLFLKMSSSKMLSFFWGNFFILIMWLISCLAEVNRSPFDFAEGESELVSGFNVEFSGGWFALIFLAEYMSMIILSIITVLLFWKDIMNILSLIMILFIASSMLIIRATLPRFRYDLLMNLNWKIILPFIILVINYPLISVNFNI